MACFVCGSGVYKTIIHTCWRTCTEEVNTLFFCLVKACLWNLCTRVCVRSLITNLYVCKRARRPFRPMDMKVKQLWHNCGTIVAAILIIQAYRVIQNRSKNYMKHVAWSLRVNKYKHDLALLYHKHHITFKLKEILNSIDVFCIFVLVN